MYTYQDFLKETDPVSAIKKVIAEHQSSKLYKTAKKADNYDHQLNETINNYVRMIFSLAGSPIEDFTASNNKISSNFFNRLNTQRCNYLLGNGVSFTDHKVKRKNEDGIEETIDETKEFLGESFDMDLKKIGYNSLIHGVCFGFWNVDKLHVFPVTEFAPLWDEETGALRAGVRFWQIDPDKPLMVVLYEEDGYTKYKSTDKKNSTFVEIQPKKAYIQQVVITEADGEQVVGEENYTNLPIIPMWGSRLRQSTLIGMQEKIDSFDLIRSGFANDLTDCSEIYWILENCAGMSEGELARFRDRLKINHIAVVDTAGEARAVPYTQEIPYSARKEYLDMIRAGIYEDFGGLDVHSVDAASTNDHLEAAYQPMDEQADDFEYQIFEFMEHLLALVGIEDTPTFKRNRISNQAEQTQMILSAAEYLDEETILQKLPFVTVDEVQYIIMRKAEENEARMQEAMDMMQETGGQAAQEDEEDELNG